MRSPKYLFRFIIGMSLLSYILSFDCTLSVSSLAQSKDDDAIRGLVKKIFELYQEKATDKLLSLWNEKSPLLIENKKALQREFAAYEQIIVKGFDIRQMKIVGDKATLRVVAEMALTRSNLVKPIETLDKKNLTIELVAQDGGWKLWKFILSEEELSAAIVEAKSDEERKVLMKREPELITSDLASALLRRNLDVETLYQKGYQHALAINRIAYELAELNADQYVMANVLINIATIYGWIGAPEKSPDLALENLRKSLKIGEVNGFKKIIGISLSNSAMLYQTLGELSPATDFYLRSLKLFEERRDPIAIIPTLNNLGIIYDLQGNSAKALEFHLRSLKMSETRLESGSDWANLSRALGNIGSVFMAQGNDDQALSYCQKAYEAAEKARTLGDSSASYLKSKLLESIAKIYLKQGDHSLSMDYYQKSLKLAEELGNTLIDLKDSSISSLKTSIGDVFSAQNNLSQAIENYKEAILMAAKSRNKTMMPYPLFRLGEIYLLRGDYREALAYAERAISAAEESGVPSYSRDALVTAARVYQKLGQPEEARQTLVRAIDVTERSREQFAGSEIDRQRSYEKFVTPYQVMIDFQAERKQFREAFSYAQRAKSRTLLELLQNGRVNIDKSSSPAKREQELPLTRKIISLNRQVTDEKLKSQPDLKRLAEVEEQLKKARSEFEAFRTTLYATHPELKVQRGEIRPISFDDVAGLIPDSKAALLDFIVTDENVHLFLLTKDASAQPALNTYTIKIERKALAEKVDRFRRRMENRDYDFQALSRELYDLLIKPAQKQLQNKTNLIISPDNVLWDLPFQALLSPELRYLIEDTAISYAPSLSVLREMRLASKKRPAPAKTSLLALGNPALGQRSRELVKFVKMDSELQPLPEAADQVRALERLYGKTLSNVYTGTAAREELVKEQSARYRILHLAAHGIFNDVSPMYSHILLSQTPGKDEEDGLLEAWEMMNLDLNADLVVLSACETARGRVGAGEGVIGMTWALFVAGCPRTVVSQWKVEASSTTALMLEFHKRFKTRLEHQKSAVSTAEAMRQAALKVMKNPEYVHPFYWGGFVVVGDGN